MRVPIALALADGVRLPGVGPRLDLRDVSPLEFLPVDAVRFPAVALARAAGERGGLAPCVLNAANEEAVTAFTEGRCRFDEIVPLVSEALAAFDDRGVLTLDDVLAADAWARERVRAGAASGAGVS
jgi:1-deoxy-D-xylulose-5-phosphate reductoisomerase